MSTPRDPKAAAIVERLGMKPHPEGGWFVETWRAEEAPGGRASGTAIYYLLEAHEFSAWHRVDAAEVWHHYEGAALRLSTCVNEPADATSVLLGPDFAAGERPQHVVPAGVWQGARTTGAFTLVGCTVSPGFRFEGFELAPSWPPPP